MKHFLQFLGLGLFSIAIYLSLFLFVVRKPMTVGIYGDMIELKANYAKGKEGARLFIVAGSNGRVSHSAALLEESLGIPAINCSLTAAVSLPFTIDQFKPLMRQGDIVFMPLEYQQYGFDLDEEKSDGHYLAAYDKATFFRQDPKRILSQMFSFDLPYLISGLGEMALMRAGGSRRFSVDDLNEQGDQIGHNVEVGKEYRESIQNWDWWGPIEPGQIDRDTFTRRHLDNFLAWARDNGILVIGGLPVTFNDVRMSDDTEESIRRIFESQGQRFVVLPNRSQYPRDHFFDSPYHLLEEYQLKHTAALVEKLRPVVEPYLSTTKGRIQPDD